MNSIQSIAGGFGLLDNGVGVDGGSGKSLNSYNRSWQQFWVGLGGVLELAVGLDADGRMVLSGEKVTPKGRVLSRITWTPNEDGTVRQQWDQSRDDGADLADRIRRIIHAQRIVLNAIQPRQKV